MADFSSGDIVKVTLEECENFKEIVKKNIQKKRYRLCLHESPQSILHDMLICREKFNYDRLHMYQNHAETHSIIEGSERIIIFSEDGKIKDTFLLNRNEGYLIYRVNPCVYHTAIHLTEFALDYETIAGTFDPSGNTFSSRVPDYQNQEAVIIFIFKEYKIQNIDGDGAC